MHRTCGHVDRTRQLAASEKNSTDTPWLLISRRTQAQETLQFLPCMEIPNLPTENLHLLLDRLNLVMTSRHHKILSWLLSATPEDNEGELHTCDQLSPLDTQRSVRGVPNDCQQHSALPKTMPTDVASPCWSEN